MINRKFCSMVVSNTKDADPAREKFFRLLSDYQRVDSGGRYLNNVGCPEGVKDKILFQSEYKFGIAFENSSHPGYCTEKIIQAFAAGTIPIYWGDPTVGDFFNPRAFINCHEYHSFEEAIEFIKYIDQNDDVYSSMLMQSAVDKQKIDDLKAGFSSWLIHIFEQNWSDAFRRNRYGRCAVYQRELLRKYEKESSKFSVIKSKVRSLLG